MRFYFTHIVHCQWDAWIIGNCNVECGGGNRTNTRSQKTLASHGGKECDGSASIEEVCNVHKCPGINLSANLN